VTVAGRDINAQLLADLQPDMLLIRSVTPVDEALLANNDSVKFVGSATIGTDHVDQDYLAARNITFANAAGCSKHSVAQYVVTAILNLRPQYWQQSITPLTLGIIGIGNIGSTLAQYASDLGWQILGYDPLLPSSDINNASLEQVLSQSDVVSLHVPLTDKKGEDKTSNGSDYPTRHLINAESLAMMSPHTMLINSARGPVVNADDLEADINSTKRQVVLDVFEHEPQVAESLLAKLAIATPHIAGYTVEGKLRGTQIIYDALCEKLDVTPTQTMHNLLTLNMFLWSELKAHPDRLIKFYDIMRDDAALRNKTVNGQVRGADFDQLRRDYRLRREWQF
ncbi:MAG: 4-phosphoerythronate dehydrogenase, partial [Psychrobacter sp.]|nr:4-phosphoerythronate dehydrogenase [Psychrobacter sp.]